MAHYLYIHSSHTNSHPLKKTQQDSFFLCYPFAIVCVFVFPIRYPSSSMDHSCNGQQSANPICICPFKCLPFVVSMNLLAFFSYHCNTLNSSSSGKKETRTDVSKILLLYEKKKEFVCLLFKQLLARHRRLIVSEKREKKTQRTRGK